MNASSLVSVSCRDTDAECDGCGYSGPVEEFIDLETYTAGWTCPACDKFHDTYEDITEDDPDDARDRQREGWSA